MCYLASAFARLATPALLVLLVLLGAHPAVAQNLQGQVLGTVTDPSGNAIPGAVVTLRNDLTGITYSQTTTAAGDYVFPYQDSGRYTVSVQKDGFKGSVLRGVIIQVAEKKRVDVQLEIGEVRTVVEVTAETAKVDTETASVGAVVPQQQVTNMPLYGRDFSRLALLIPGTRPQGGRDSYTGGNFVTQWGTAVNIGGGGWEKNSYTMDGVDNSMRGDGGPAVNPSVDAIQEFRVLRSIPTADYGLGSAVIETVTKAGTNQFHGRLWEYLRNYKLNAGNYLSHQQDTLKRNQFGANLGGPIVKDRAFFFFNWESLRLRSNQQLTATVLTAKGRTGDLSEYPENPIDPETGKAFANKTLPTARLSPVSLAYVKSFMPLPNRPGVTLNYLALQTSNDSWDQFIGRFDYYTTSAKDRVFLRFMTQPRQGTRAGISPFNAQAEDQHFHNAGIGWLRTWAASLTSEVRFGLHQERSIFSQATYHDPQPRIKGFGQRPVVPNGDLISWGGYQSFGDFGYPIAFHRKDAYVNTNASIFAGKHLVKVGFQADRQQYNFDLYPQWVSIVYFNNIYSASSPADLLLGLPYQAQDRMGFARQNLRGQTYSAFVHDDWRITPTLTLNLGLRYDLITVPYDANDIYGTFDPKLGKIVVAGNRVVGEVVNPFLLNGWAPLYTTADKAGLPLRTLGYGDHNNVGPRFGFAWRPFKNNKTVVRGGYGILYLLSNQTNVNNSNFSAPYSQRMTVVNTRPTPSFTIAEPFTSPVIPPPLTYAFEANKRTPYMQQATLGIQQELRWGLVAELLLQDQHSKKLETGYDANTARMGTGSVNSRRPFYPTFGPGIFTLHNEGTSRYDSLELEIRRTGLHYSFSWSHVWAKQLGWGFGAFLPSNIVYPYERSMFRGPGPYVPHVDKVSFLLDLPFGKGRRYLNQGGPVDIVLGGWTVAGYAAYQSGSPLTIGWSGDSANVGIFGVRPNRICDGKIDNPTMDRWFDTSCFVAPTPGTFGNSGTGILTGPSSFGADFSVLKNFSIRERAELQFRGEFFNIFNHPNLAGPGTTANSPASYGKILTKSLDPRVVQLALRLSF